MLAALTMSFTPIVLSLGRKMIGTTEDLIYVHNMNFRTYN